MKTTVSEHDFKDAFRTYGRTDRFSYDGLAALYEHLEQYEEDTGEEIELDVISLCCDYSEYDSAVECISDLGYDFEPEGDDEEEREESALEWLRDHTTVIEFNGGMIVGAF